MELEERGLIDEVIAECRRCDQASSGFVTPDEFIEIFNAIDINLKDKERWALENFLHSQVEGIEYELLVPRLLNAADRSDLFRELLDDTTEAVTDAESDGEESVKETAVVEAAVVESRAFSREKGGGRATTSRGGSAHPPSRERSSKQQRGGSRKATPGSPTIDGLDASAGKLRAYARNIGMETHEYKDLLWLAKEGAEQALPEGWTKVVDPEGNTFYSDELTGENRRIHPNVDYFRKLLVTIRSYFGKPGQPKFADAKDIINCVRDLGLEPTEDTVYFWIAEECLESSLPENWFQYETSEGDKFYYNATDEATTWAHPRAPEFTDLVNSLKYYLSPEDAHKNKCWSLVTNSKPSFSPLLRTQPIAKFAQKIKMLLPEHCQLLWIAEEGVEVPKEGLYVKGERRIPHKYYRDLYIAVRDSLSHNLPAAKSIVDYARHIGLDPAKEFNLLWLAEEGLSAELPEGWVEVKDDNGEPFFYNEETRVSTWRHPADDYYEDLAKALIETLGKNPPASKDIVATARNLGMEPLKDAKMLWIADECVRSPLPDGWIESYDPAGGTFYFNTKRNLSSWTHPADEYYKEVYERVKQAEPADVEYYRFFYLFGKDDKVKEKLLTLQRVYRGYRARRFFKRLMKRNESTKVIQRAWKRYRLRCVLSMHKQLVAAARLVRNVRSFLPRWWFRKHVVRIQRNVKLWLFLKKRREAAELLQRAMRLFLFRLERRKAAIAIQRSYRRAQWLRKYKYLRAARIMTRSVRLYLFRKKRLQAIQKIQAKAREFLEVLRARKAAILLQKTWRRVWKPALICWKAASKIQRMARRWLGTRTQFHAALVLQRWARPIIKWLKKENAAKKIQRFYRLVLWRRRRKIAVRTIERAVAYKKERWLRKLRRGLDNFFYSIVQIQAFSRVFLAKCRVRDRCVELLVISLQRAVRRFLAYRRVKNARERRVEVWAATRIQRWTRGALVRSRLSRMADRTLLSHSAHYAATLIQSMFRGVKARRLLRERAFFVREAALSAAATSIQSWFRAERERRYLRLLALVRKRPLMASRIQQWWRRRKLVRRMIEVAEGGFFEANYRFYLEYHYSCAEKIQALWRGYRARTKLDDTLLATEAAKTAATKVQSWWKGVRIATLLKPRLRARMTLRRRADGATKIQSWFRGVLHRYIYSIATKEFRRRTAATTLQRCYRGYKGRQRAAQKQEQRRIETATIAIQSFWRGTVGRSLAGWRRKEREMERETTKKRTQIQMVQAQVRGWLQRCRFSRDRRRIRAAITIQRVFRGHRQRLATELLKAKLRILKGALTAQKIGRGWQGRREFKEEWRRVFRERCAIQIQSWLRQRFAYFEFRSRRQRVLDTEAAKIQSLFRGIHARVFFGRLVAHRDRLLAQGVLARNMRMWLQRKKFRRDVLAPARLEKGAMMMQNVVRGGLARKRAAALRERKEREAAAVKIQSIFRGYKGRKAVRKRRLVFGARKAARVLEAAFTRYRSIRKRSAVLSLVKEEGELKRIIATIRLQRFWKKLKLKELCKGAALFAFQAFMARTIQCWWRAARRRLQRRRQKERRVRMEIEKERERRKEQEEKTRRQIEVAEREAELELTREKMREGERVFEGQLSKRESGRFAPPSSLAVAAATTTPKGAAPFPVGRKGGAGGEEGREVASPRPPLSSPRKRFRAHAPRRAQWNVEEDDMEDAPPLPSPLTRSRLAPSPPPGAPIQSSPRRHRHHATEARTLDLQDGDEFVPELLPTKASEREANKESAEAEKRKLDIEKKRKPRSLRAAERLLEGWGGAKFSPKVRIKAASLTSGGGAIGGWVRPSEGFVASPASLQRKLDADLSLDAPVPPLSLMNGTAFDEQNASYPMSAPSMHRDVRERERELEATSTLSPSSFLAKRAKEMRSTFSSMTERTTEDSIGANEDYRGFLPPIPPNRLNTVR